MRGLYIPDLEIPENCMGCNYRDPSYGNCCELMIDNPSDSFEEQYRLCPIRILCKNAVSASDVRPVVRGKWRLGGYGQISDATVKWYDQFLHGGFLYCSNCKERTSVKTNYCPNCGAMMEES